jgi:IS5 family transposase
VRLAKKTGVELRQSYERVGKPALVAHQCYAHAEQFERADRALKTIRSYLAGTHGDAANAFLAAAGYNFRRVLEWLALLLSAILAARKTVATQQGPFKLA